MLAVLLFEQAPLRLLLGGSSQEAVFAAAEKFIGGCVDPLVSTQLFNGETTYVDNTSIKWDGLDTVPALKMLQQLVNRQGVAASVVEMRGKLSFFSRSQLEMACGEL